MTRMRRIGDAGPVPTFVLTQVVEDECKTIEIDPKTVLSVKATAAAWTEVKYLTAGSENSVVLVVEVLGSVLQKIREALAEAPDASDELRLAAGWVQEFRRLDGSMGWRYPRVEGTPAPLPAGGWRHVGDGLSMRWVLPKRKV